MSILTVAYPVLVGFPFIYPHCLAPTSVILFDCLGCVARWHGGMVAWSLGLLVFTALWLYVLNVHDTTAAFAGNNKSWSSKFTYSSLMDPLRVSIPTFQSSNDDESNDDEILCIALSRDGKTVASLSKKGLIHIWEAPQDGTQGETLENAKALHVANISTIEAFNSDGVTKSITVANSDDVCAVSFVPRINPFTTGGNYFGEEIIQGHIGPALQRAFKRSKIEPISKSASYPSIVIQFPIKSTSPGGEDPPDSSETPKTPAYNQAEQGGIDPPVESKPKIQKIQHCSSTVFFDVGTLHDSDHESMFVCCPPYVRVYRRNNPMNDYYIARIIYFNICDIMQSLDHDLHVSDLQSKVNRFALMYQSIPQLNEESYKLRMAMLLNIRAMDVRWERRFALSSDGSRLAVLSNVDATGVLSRYITVHILLMKTGFEVIRWRSEVTPDKVSFHDSGNKLFIVTKKQILLYDVNTGNVIKEPMERDGNCMCLHSARHYYLKPKNQTIEVKTLVPRPKNERMTLEFKLVNIIEKKKEYFQDNQWALNIMQDKNNEQWICCIKNTISEDSEERKFSFQPVGKMAPENKHYSLFNNDHHKFRFGVTTTGDVLIITSVTIQLWSPSSEDDNYTLCDFWCISKLGQLREGHPTVIDLEWNGMKVDTTVKDKLGVILCIKEDEGSDSKSYAEIVMNMPKVPDSPNVLDSNAPNAPSASNTPKVEEQMAFSCCWYLMLLSRMIKENQCDWIDSPREIENVPELTVEIKKTLQKYIPAYRFPRIYIRFIDSPILYLFNFENLDDVFTEYRGYRRCIFSWIYESDETPERLFSYVSDNVVKAKIVRWLIRKIQRGETAYGFFLQKQLPILMSENPELVGEIARGLSYQICVAPIVEKPVFLRQARWPELHNLDMEILAQFNHLDPIIQFTNHVDFPNGFKFVWLAIESRCRWFLISRLRRWKREILQFSPNFSSHPRSGSVCVVPLPGLCTYDDGTSKSAFTQIAEITLERNFVEIAEPFLEAVVNHKWRAFARQRFYLLFVIYIIYFSLFVILLIKDLPGAKQLSSKDMWIPGLFCAIAGCFLILELLKVWRRPRAYLFVLSNYLELCAFIIPIWYASWVMRSYPVPPGLRSASVLFIWFRMHYRFHFSQLMQLRINKSVGIFIAVISEIIRKMIPFLVVLMMAYLGFTQAFYELLRHTLPQIAADGVVEGTIDNTVANLSFIPTDSNGQNYSQDFPTVLTNVFFFTAQNYSTMATFAPNVTVLLILFAALIGILLFNVLIALLNNVYTNALESGQRLWLLLFVQIVADIELLPIIGAYRQRNRTDWFPQYIYYIAYDNEIAAYEKAIAQDDDKARRILKWGPDKQFSDVWENIPDVVEALFDYKPEGKKHHLPLERGQLVDVIRAFPSGWWYGKYKNKEGLFPCNFVGPSTAGRRSRPPSGGVRRRLSNISLNSMKTLVSNTSASSEANTLAPPEASQVNPEDASNEPPELDVRYDGRLWFPSEGLLPTPRNDV